MRVGIALRSTVYAPGLVGKLLTELDRSEVDSLWFPSVGPGFDSLDMCAIALGRSNRLKVGTGVIRSSESDGRSLFARINTMSEASDGRFILGIGTGAGTGGDAIGQLVELTEELRSRFSGRQGPPIFFAALKRKMLQAAFQRADGAILNFCPPSYVKKIAEGRPAKEPFALCCYIKLFFAANDATARRMLVKEFKAYDGIPQYHEMFRQIGVAEELTSLEPNRISDNLLQISLANPNDAQMLSMLREFERAGVDLPILYPYVDGDEESKRTVVGRLANIAAKVV